MQSRLEDVLREKERELKLYQKFVNLRSFCEEQLFPFAPVPLQKHVERLKVFIEQLIPEPLSRTEEFFSGEIFVLLCALYFHDIGVVSSYRWGASEEVFERIDTPPKTLFLNYEIGKRLGIPASAIELTNAIIFSPMAKKIPVEWEIVEDSKKAIIRNGRLLEQIFNFSHLIWDIFSADSAHVSLRRFQDPDLRLRCGDASLSIDSREGVIYIKCRPEVPYQTHVLGRMKAHVDGLFKRFREQVNGRLGFQYREIAWDIGGGEGPGGEAKPPDLFPFTVYHQLPFLRWDEASVLLDKLFKYGHVIVVGGPGAGKSTLVNSFVVPQLKRVSSRVFCCEMWDHPVNEVREAVAGSEEADLEGPDILSVLNKLVKQQPCFLVLDCCERLAHVTEGEREKFQRLVDFCLATEDMYLIILGDKEEFFDWYQPFKGTNLSALFEINPLERLMVRDDFISVTARETVPLEILKAVMDGILQKVADRDRFREAVAVLVDLHLRGLKRYTVDDIVADTLLSPETVTEYMGFLMEQGIVKEMPLLNAVYYCLTSRHLKESLHGLLQLGEFDEKKRLREALVRAAEKAEPLAGETLQAIHKWYGSMAFSRDEQGIILVSLEIAGPAVRSALPAFEAGLAGASAEPIMKFLESGKPEVRIGAVDCLYRLGDESATNSLLALLRREGETAIRERIVAGAVESGRKKAIVALMKVLLEMGDREGRLRVSDMVGAFPDDEARELLIDLAEMEKDPGVIEKMDALLARLEG